MTDESNRSDSIQSIQHAMRVVTQALARRPDLDLLNKSNDSQGNVAALLSTFLSGPPSRRKLGALRGAADAIAMRLRYHDERLSPPRNYPQAAARDILDALFQVRCEALGRRSFPGVASNLDAELEARSVRELWTATFERQEIDLPLALSLLALEVIAGVSLPPAASHLAGIWRTELRGVVANRGSADNSWRIKPSSRMPLSSC